MMIHYLNWIRTGSVDCSDHLGWIKTGSGGYGDLGIRKKKTNIAASSDGGPKPMQNATPVASGKRCPAGTCIYR